MILVVSGSRKATQAQHGAFVYDILDTFHAQTPVTHLHHGAAKGVDLLAAAWAVSRSIPVTPHPANWNRYGKSAGPIRNRDMLDAASPDYWIAFPIMDSKGTIDFINEASRRKIPGMISYLEIPS